MSSRFHYRYVRRSNNIPQREDDEASEGTNSTATLADDISTYGGGIDTPEASDGDNDDDNFSDQENLGFGGTPSPPDPELVVTQIQKAAEDVSQLVGRFGPKMVNAVQRLNIKQLLFADRRSLQLPCLRDADNFTCRVTKLYGKRPGDSPYSAPLLWWLWDSLLDYSEPKTGLYKFTLEFTPAPQTYTNIRVPYPITIKLGMKDNKDNLELTAWYGGRFKEVRIFDAPVTKFRFRETKQKWGHVTKHALDMDQHTYNEEEGCVADTLDYLMPPSESLWRQAMKNFPQEEEETLLLELVGTCRGGDDATCYSMSDNQEEQCRNLLKRFPPEAKRHINENQLAGKTIERYSKRANGPSCPKS